MNPQISLSGASFTISAQSDTAVRSGLGWNVRALVLESISRTPSHFPKKGHSAGAELAFITVTAVRTAGCADVKSWDAMRTSPNIAAERLGLSGSGNFKLDQTFDRFYSPYEILEKMPGYLGIVLE